MSLKMRRGGDVLRVTVDRGFIGKCDRNGGGALEPMDRRTPTEFQFRVWGSSVALIACMLPTLIHDSIKCTQSMKTTQDRRLAKLSDELNIPYYLESKWGVRHLIVSWGWMTRVAEEGRRSFGVHWFCMETEILIWKRLGRITRQMLHAANQVAISFPT